MPDTTTTTYTTSSWLNTTSSSMELSHPSRSKYNITPLHYEQLPVAVHEAEHSRVIGGLFGGAVMFAVVAFMLITDGIGAFIAHKLRQSKIHPISSDDNNTTASDLESNAPSLEAENYKTNNMGNLVMAISETCQLTTLASVKIVQSPINKAKRKRKTRKSKEKHLGKEERNKKFLTLRQLMKLKYGKMPRVIRDMKFLNHVVIDVKKYHSRKILAAPRLVKRSPSYRKFQFQESCERAFIKARENMFDFYRVAYIHQHVNLSFQRQKPKIKNSS